MICQGLRSASADLDNQSVIPTLPPLGDGAGEETFNRARAVLLAGRFAGLGEDIRRRAVPVFGADGGAQSCRIGLRTESDARRRSSDLSAPVMAIAGRRH